MTRYILRFAFLLLALGALSLRPVFAQDLREAYLLPDLFEIMAEEGRAAYGADVDGFFDAQQLQDWQQELHRIYDPEQMEKAFVTAISGFLSDQPDAARDALEFARTPLGQRVLGLEVSARRALLDPEVDAFAQARLDDARSDTAGTSDARRLELVRKRISVNDLIELNVQLGMNTSFAYYKAMAQAGALEPLGEDDILALVWEQEQDIRIDVTDWMESYFMMAFHPLTDTELEDYIIFSQSASGIAFNTAMFHAFDAVFVRISSRVGAAFAARLMTSQL